MRKHIHILHYLILALILGSGFFMLLFYQGRPQLQYYIGIGMAVSYFCWGVVHHYIMGDLRRKYTKYMVEYGLIALFSIFLLNKVLI